MESTCKTIGIGILCSDCKLSKSLYNASFYSNIKKNIVYTLQLIVYLLYYSLYAYFITHCMST